MATVYLFTIPLGNNLPWYKFKITLSGTIFTLSVRYNTRSSRWLMDISDPSGNIILAGIPVLIQRDMTGQYPTLAIPSGTFFSTDDTGQGNQPTLYSFGTDHTLWYVGTQ
jgi:hypothetical protein